MKTPRTDLDIVRSFMRTKLRKEAYNSARMALPGRLRQAYPHIYRELMDESLKSLSTYLDKEVESRLWTLQGSLANMASKIRRNAAERARRKRSRLQKEEPEC